MPNNKSLKQLPIPNNDPAATTPQSRSNFLLFMMDLSSFPRLDQERRRETQNRGLAPAGQNPEDQRHGQQAVLHPSIT